MILIAELISHFVNGNVNMTTVKKTIKKAQSGIMDKKLTDVAGKAWNEIKKPRPEFNVSKKVDKVMNKAVDRVKNATVGDAVDVMYPGVRGAYNAVKSLKKSKNGSKVMLKRKDGSTSQRGLWDNIRANKGSGKKPTAAMLKQEKKIKAKSK